MHSKWLPGIEGAALDAAVEGRAALAAGGLRRGVAGELGAAARALHPLLEHGHVGRPWLAIGLHPCGLAGRSGLTRPTSRGSASPDGRGRGHRPGIHADGICALAWSRGSEGGGADRRQRAVVKPPRPRPAGCLTGCLSTFPTDAYVRVSSLGPVLSGPLRVLECVGPTPPTPRCGAGFSERDRCAPTTRETRAILRCHPRPSSGPGLRIRVSLWLGWSSCSRARPSGAMSQIFRPRANALARTSLLAASSSSCSSHRSCSR